MQIDIPNENAQEIRTKAVAAGFNDLADYIIALAQRDNGWDNAPNPEPNDAEQNELPYQEWKQRLHAFVKKQPSTNPNFDDSRFKVITETKRC